MILQSATLIRRKNWKQEGKKRKQTTEKKDKNNKNNSNKKKKVQNGLHKLFRRALPFVFSKCDSAILKL